MKTYLECVSCLSKQAVDIASSHLPADQREGYVRDMVHQLADFDFTKSPPMLAKDMYGAARRLADIHDPYATQKDRYNKVALGLYPALKERVLKSSDPLDMALRIAVSGNIIDFGLASEADIDVEATVERAIASDFAIDHIEKLKAQLKAAATVLYIGDNAGEIVFDRLFIEIIGPEKVTYVVRSEPIINDVTLLDADQVAMPCAVIESGSGAPGTPLELCNDLFLNHYEKADVVLSKGQGNFETMSCPPREQFFLLMAKCDVVANDLGVERGSFIALSRG